MGGARGREIGDGEEGMNGWDGWDGWDRRVQTEYCLLFFRIYPFYGWSAHFISYLVWECYDVI